MSSPKAQGSAENGGGQIVSAEDLTDEKLLKSIVENLNKVLGRTYSLVDFDSLKGVELLMAVRDLFANLSPVMNVNVEANPNDEAIELMIDFLVKTLGYRVPPLIATSFPSSFAQAETTVVYPVLYWVLTRMEQNVKRVYLARFLQPISVPDALRAQDEDVRNLFDQYQQLRAVFVQTHRQVEELRSAHQDPIEGRRVVASLEEQREKLNGYIKAADAKLGNVGEKDALLAAAKDLRTALDEDSKQSEKRVEQQQLLISVQQRSTEMQRRLQCARRDASDLRVDVIVRRMKDDITMHQMKLDEELPKEIDMKRNENEEFNRLLSEPLDMAALIAQNKTLDDELLVLQEKIDERQQPGEDGNSVLAIRQQVDRVKERKSKVLEDLTEVQGENNRTLADIREKEMNIAELRGASNMLNGDDFKQFTKQVRTKKATTEQMRQKIAELRAEWGVLTYTESALKSQYAQLEGQIGHLEGKLGLHGYSRTVEALSQVSHEKDALEMMKGKTLEELSQVVQEFTMTIRDRRTKLAPMINELRTVRQSAAECHQEWAELKNQYEYREGILMEDTQKQTQEVQTLKEEAQSNESLFHRLTVQQSLTKGMLQRADEERKFSSDPSAAMDPQYKTYMDYLTTTTRNIESRTKDLQSKHRDVDENYSNNVLQVEWFNQLKKILTAKVQSLQSGQQNRHALDREIQDVMRGGAGNRRGARDGGADVFVLED